MIQATTDAALQAAAQQVVALNGAQAIGIAWYDAPRRDLVWAALAGPTETEGTLASLAQRVVNSGTPVRETRDGKWIWGTPVTAPSVHGAVVAVGNGHSPFHQGLLNVLSETASLAAVLATERRRSARLQRWLTESGRTLAAGNIVVGFAHRITNPLTTVIGEAQLLQSEALSAGALTSLAAIERAGQRIRNTVQAVVQFTQPYEAEETTNVNRTVETALGLVASQLEGAGIRLTARQAPNLPPVRADAGALTEAWVQLLMNARRAIPSGHAGEVRIGTSLREGGYILVSVTDNGPVSSRRRRLVQPFAADTRLELFLAWDIITRAGGQLTVTSRPGTGTTIGARIPVSD